MPGGGNASLFKHVAIAAFGAAAGASVAIGAIGSGKEKQTDSNPSKKIGAASKEQTFEDVVQKSPPFGG